MQAPSLREALKRLLGLVPTVLLVSMMAFWGLSHALSNRSPTGDQPLPLFFNRAPVDVAERARALALLIAKGTAPHETLTSSPQAVELTRLGGAALPGLMPFLDSLPPQHRARVALALMPLAKRMGIADPEDFETPEAATAFWSRYWLDRSIDFRPRVVERAIHRLVQRPSALRRAEIHQLDTYALAELMGAIDTERDPATLAQLLSVVSHITGGACIADGNADLHQQARSCSKWWSIEGHRFARFDGNRRLVAMLQQTQYGQWVLGFLRGELGPTTSSPSIHWSLLPTLALIAAAIVGGYGMGPILAAWAATLPRRRYLVLTASLIVASLPAAAVASWLHRGVWASEVLALAAMVLLGASALCIDQYQAMRDACGFDFVRLQRAYGASRLRAALNALSSSSIASAVHLANHGASLLTAACVVEWAFDWHGLGWLTVQAVHARDVSTLTAIAMLGTIFSGALQIASNLLLSRFARSTQAAS